MFGSPGRFHKCHSLPSLIHKIICCTHCQWKCPCTISFTPHARFSRATNHPTSSHGWYPMACPLILWFPTRKPRHGTWGRNLIQLLCPKHCLNWKEEGITANINIPVQMQSLHLTELAQKHSVSPCWRPAEDSYVLIAQTISSTWKQRAIQDLNRVCGFRVICTAKSIRFAPLLRGLQIPMLV